MAGPCVVGVDLGGTKLLAGALNDRLEPLRVARREVRGLDRDALLGVVVDAVEELRAAVGDEPLAAAGFGIPALIDRERGVAVSCVHLPLAGVAFGEVMEERLGLPAFVDNDANLAALAEH